MLWFSYNCNDRRYSYFTRNTYNRYVDSFKKLFRTQSQACFVIVTTLWRPGFTEFLLRNILIDRKAMMAMPALTNDYRTPPAWLLNISHPLRITAIRKTQSFY